MKLSTHNISGTAIAFTILMKIIGRNSLSNTLTMFFTALILSIIINTAIDFLYGHRGGRRTPWTHSIIGATIISIAISIAITIAIESIGIGLEPETHLVITTTCFSIALLHIALDMLTAGGVYLLWPFNKKRYSLLKIPYNDKTINILITLLSTTIILYLLIP